MNPSFSIDLSFNQRISAPFRSALSLSQYTSPIEKELSDTEHTSLARLRPTEHLEELSNAGFQLDEGMPCLLISVRNVLSNLRCFGFVRDKHPAPISVVGDRIGDSARPFFVLAGRDDGTVTATRLNNAARMPNDWQWAISGVPVCWKGVGSDELFRCIVSESSDGAHVWRMFRGNHPMATDDTRAVFREYTSKIRKALGEDAETASGRLVDFAVSRELEREEKVFHHAVGVDREGNLVQHGSVGRLEDVGARIAGLGAENAIIVDNSGSSTVRYRAAGSGTWIPLFCLPNHREAGTAYLAIECAKDNCGYKIGL